jgi:hypothetical protein
LDFVKFSEKAAAPLNWHAFCFVQWRGGDEEMAAPAPLAGPSPMDVTLLELIGVLGDLTEDDQEVVSVALHMIRSGSVRLCGSFQGRLEDF